MKTAMVGNIQVQTAGRKKSDFDFSHTVNTTARFGELQPIQCVKVNAHSKYKCNASTVIRALPLVAPVTSGSIKAKVYHKFVGMSDLLNSWPSYLTGQPKQTSSGPVRFTQPPTMLLRDLSAFCLIGCKFSIYALDNDSTTLPASVESATTKWIMPSKLGDIDAIFTILNTSTPLLRTRASNNLSTHQAAFNSRFGDYASSLNYAVPLNLFSPLLENAYIPCWNSLIPESAFNVDGTSNKLNANVDIRNCDFVFTRVLDAGDVTGLGVDIDGQLKIGIAVNMSDIGLRFYKALVGLGYKPDFNSAASVDITRFFAMYKAYFDSFGLTLWTNYELSDAYYLLKRFENSVGFSLVWTDTSVDDVRDALVRFMLDCAEMYVTDPLDYISAHRRQDVTSPVASNAGFVSNIVLANENMSTYPGDGAFDTGWNSGSYAETSFITPATRSIYINKVTHTQVDADLLKILYRSVNVQTVAGKRLAELLRAGGYGPFVDECKSSFIGMDEIELDITDINATADSTNDVTGRNSTLGETVGKGLALKSARKDTYHDYETEEFGYWITLMCFVPESSYVQGVDQTIYDVDKFDEYQPDFDSVGYEIQNKSVVAAGGDWFNGDAGLSASDSAFGFVPRYLRYKVPQSIINGGFLRRSERDYFLNYCLDRFIHFNDRAETSEPVDDPDSGRVTYTLTKYMDVVDMPLAGNAWRYVNRYPWLASFERIFAYVGDVLKLGGLTSYGIDVQLARWRYCNFGEDGFMFFCRFFAGKFSPMLPLTKSWSTIDEPDKDGSVSMRQA